MRNKSKAAGGGIGAIFHRDIHSVVLFWAGCSKPSADTQESVAAPAIDTPGRGDCPREDRAARAVDARSAIVPVQTTSVQTGLLTGHARIRPGVVSSGNAEPGCRPGRGRRQERTGVSGDWVKAGG